MSQTIQQVMTRQVHCIGTRSTLRDAHELMRSHGIRHLPVLEVHKLVGLVSERDLHLVETLRDVDPREVTVEEAMSQGVLSVEPETPLAEVVAQMAARKCGSAVVARGGVVEGIFTTVDALRVLGELLTAPLGKGPASSRASKERRHV